LTWYGDGGEVTRPDGDVAAHQETLGASLASGDEDGDGILDLVLGAPGFSTDYADLSPGAYVVPGTWY
jgi:hypothetical protein